MSINLGALTCWNPVGLFRPLMGQLLDNISHQYCAGDEIEKNEFGVACSAYWGSRGGRGQA